MEINWNTDDEILKLEFKIDLIVWKSTLSQMKSLQIASLK